MRYDNFKRNIRSIIGIAAICVIIFSCKTMTIPKPDPSMVGYYSIKSIDAYHLIHQKRYQARAILDLKMPYEKLAPTIQAVALEVYRKNTDARIVGVFISLNCHTIARAELSVDRRDWSGEKAAPTWTIETMPKECWPLTKEARLKAELGCDNPDTYNWYDETTACIWKKSFQEVLIIE